MKSAEKLNLTKSTALLKEAVEITPGGMLGIRRPLKAIT